MSMREQLSECWKVQWKILTLRATRDDFFSLGKREFLWGLFWVWMAGIGRAWDSSDAHWVMRSGLPSVAYIFVLSIFLWLLIAPLRPASWSFRRLVVFVAMTGLPGILYAIPLEMMLPPEDTANGNSLLLLIVALWRVAMLTSYLWRVTALSWLPVTVALFLPLCTIINVLIFTDRFEKTFAVMGSIRYVALVDEELAKQAIAPYSESKDPVADGWSWHQHYRNLEPLRDPTGRLRRPVYRYHAFVGPPRGFKEVSWDDPEFIPPSPLMAVLRPLGQVSLAAWPWLAVLYLVVVFKAILSRPARRPTTAPTPTAAQDGAVMQPSASEPAPDQSSYNGT